MGDRADARATAFVVLADPGGMLPGMDWCRAVSAATDAMASGTLLRSWAGYPDEADRTVCFRFAYYTEDRLAKIKVLLGGVRQRFPSVFITITTGLIERVDPPPPIP
jgi:hypothetical protein